MLLQFGGGCAVVVDGAEDGEMVHESVFSRESRLACTCMTKAVDMKSSHLTRDCVVKVEDKQALGCPP